jgi:signal transduction histidine kinase
MKHADTNKILIIDDERPILEMLEISLAADGYEVVTAENGRKGIQALKERGLKLVLTDIKMPGMDGIEVLKRVKSIDNEAEVIVITGHGDMDSAIAAMRNGASDFITKPIRDEILTLALQRAKDKISLTQQLKDYTNNLEDKVEACRVELRQAHEALLQKERLATIGETVAGLAHYIKNILTGLRGGRYMVNRGMARDKPEMLKDGWAMVERNIERVSGLVLDLLRYSKDRVPERSVCRPNEIAREAVALFGERAREHKVMLTTALDDGIQDAYLDREGIYHVLLNLLSNAIDACIYDPDTSKKWQVIVKSGLEKDPESGETIVLEVTDNGIGMTDQVKERLFSRFFSTKGGHGTGLGLLVTEKIVKEHGGRIAVESSLGEGTTFSVRLGRQIPDQTAPSA